MMRYDVQYTDDVLESLESYRRHRPQDFKKVGKLVLELYDHPRSGTGHPEPLVGHNGITWSRSINKKDRMVYDIYDDKVVVLLLSIEGHYDDK